MQHTFLVTLVAKELVAQVWIYFGFSLIHTNIYIH